MEVLLDAAKRSLELARTGVEAEEDHEKDRPQKGVGGGERALAHGPQVTWRALSGQRTNPLDSGAIYCSMRWLVLTLALVAACRSTTGPAPAYDFDPVTAYLAHAVDSIGLPGAALVIEQGGRVVYAESFGTVDAESDMRMASSSKWLTAATILALVAEGRLSLDRPVGEILPWFDTPALRTITLRHLLSNTSGVGFFIRCALEFESNPRDDSESLASCSQVVAAFGVSGPPGTQFRYSNPGFTVAGAVAEEVTGESWHELFASRIGDRLGMQRTDFAGGTNPRLGGGGWSTPREYVRFLRMIADGGAWQGRRVLPAALVDEMLRDQTIGAEIVFTPRTPDLRYGLGLWRDRVGPGGVALEVSSPGSTGFVPWIDLERDLVAVLYVPPDLGGTFPLWYETQRLVREAVPPVD